MTTESFEQIDNLKPFLNSVKSLQSARFASITYRSKSTGEVARHTVLLNFSYGNAISKSISQLKKLKSSIKTEIDTLAYDEVMASLVKSREAHKSGKQNEDFTKKDLYIPLGNGLNLNKNDGSIQLYAMTINKVVIHEGIEKNVNSKPITIAKNELKKKLAIGKFREFSIDNQNALLFRSSGDTIELSNIEPVELNNTSNENVGVTIDNDREKERVYQECVNAYDDSDDE